MIEYFSPDDVGIGADEFSRREQLTLEKINQKVAAAESLDRVMDFLFDETHLSCPFDRLGLAFFEEDSGRMVSYWNRATYEPLLLDKGYSRPLRGSTLAKVLETGETRLINDLELYLEDKPSSESTRLLVKEGVRSSMTCPLVVEGRRVGVLFRSSTDPFAYGPHQVALHTAISERLSQAVEKAYRIEQLTRANKAYAELLSFVSHELRGPVASMVMQAQTLADGMVGELNDRQKGKIDRIIARGDHILKLIRDYLDLARIEGGEIEAHPKDDTKLRDEVIEPAMDNVAEALQEKTIEVELDLPDAELSVECDPALMQIAITNLLSNAIKYGDDPGRIRLSASADERGLELSVWNEGPGFSDEEKGLLFRKFSRLTKAELHRRGGTGVGLYTVARIVQLHGGSIEARSQEGRFAEFTIQIPQPIPKRAYAEG
jgi:hypothetical protein